MHEDHDMSTWAVALEGHAFDLLDWQAAFGPHFEPVVERLPQGEVVLRSRQFATLNDATDVLERGRLLVTLLNGTMRLYNRCQPVSAGHVMRFDGAGGRQIYLTLESAVMARSRVSAVGVAIGPDGTPVTSAPAPSVPQQNAVMAENDDRIADLLHYFGRADNWYDLYKTIECARTLSGGEDDLQALVEDIRPPMKRVKQTANFYRHASTPRPAKPVTMEEARTFLAAMVRRVLDAAASTA